MQDNKSASDQVSEDILWIKDPLAIFGESCQRGLVVQGSKIVELIASGQEPVNRIDVVFDASNHVITPGLINTHHHFF